MSAEINKAVLDKIHAGEGTLSEYSVDDAIEWINRVPFKVLENHMKSEGWRFAWEDEYDKLTGMKLRELAESQMYEDPSFVAESISNCTDIKLELES